jgi:hypothetical protein
MERNTTAGGKRKWTTQAAQLLLTAAAILVVFSSALAQTSAQFLGAGGTGSASVNTTGPWTAAVDSSGAGWITITSAASGTGNSTISYSVGRNATGASRTGAIVVTPQGGAVQSVSITQAALVTGAPTITVAPSSSSNNPQVFTIAVSDPNGINNIYYAQALINASQSSSYNSCYLYFSSPYTIWLLSDSASAWLGPLSFSSGGQPLTSTPLSNSQCQINSANASMSISADTSTATYVLPMTASSTFVGINTISAWAVYMVGASDYSVMWVSAGTWAPYPPQNVPPQASQASPSSGSGASQSFQFTLSDVNGYRYLQNLQLTFANGSNSCSLYFWTGSSYVQLSDSAGNYQLAYVDGSTYRWGPGSPFCSSGAPSVNASGNNLTLTLPLSFALSFAGSINISGWVYDKAWQGAAVPSSTWTVPSSASLTLSPASAQFLGAGGQAFINVNATGPWTAAVDSNGAGWITITSATSGAGNSTISYSVGRNATGASRTGAIVVTPQGGAAQSVSITQGALVTGAPTMAAAPSSSSNSQQTFTFTFADPNGIANIYYMQVQINVG